MPRAPDSGRLDLAEVFRRVQERMRAALKEARLLEHATAAGDAAEQVWLDLLHRYLPKRFVAAPAFVVDADGMRSRQIDIAIYDAYNFPALFVPGVTSNLSRVHIPVESVYAVFEVKPTISRQWMRDAVEKAESVRGLRRAFAGGRNHKSSDEILAGLLAAGSVWKSDSFAKNLRGALSACSEGHLDLGCSLEHGAFEHSSHETQVCAADEPLMFFVLRLVERLRMMGGRRSVDLMQYGRGMRWFEGLRDSPRAPFRRFTVPPFHVEYDPTKLGR